MTEQQTAQPAPNTAHKRWRLNPYGNWECVVSCAACGRIRVYAPGHVKRLHTTLCGKCSAKLKWANNSRGG